MSAAWAAVLVAGLAAVSTGGGWLLGWAWRAARREGKVDSALEQLAEIAKDHEDRLRQGGL